MSFCIWGDAMYSPRELVRDINKVRIRGLLRTALLAMHANADGRALLLRALPREQRDEFVERSLSNVPDLESYFGAIVQRCLFKPDTTTVEGACKTIDALFHIKADPTKEFHMWLSRKRHYDIGDAATEVVDAWNNGDCLDPRGPAYRKFIESLEKALDSEVKLRETMCRDLYKRSVN
jgi:hypothetical protein